MNNNPRYSLYSRRRAVILTILAMSLSIFTLISSLLMILNGDDQWGSKRFAKKEIQDKIMITIKNGGSLESVKHIYSARTYCPYLLIDIFKSSNDSYYYEPTSLSFILRDIQVAAFQTNMHQDSIFIYNLEKIIREHERKYPFDGLEDSQKTMFENILIKLNDNYEIVQPDVSKLANEMRNQNQLVYTYLNKSNKSYFISIAALIITIVASVYQIYQSNKTNNLLKNLYLEKGKSNNGKGEDHVISHSIE